MFLNQLQTYFTQIESVGFMMHPLKWGPIMVNHLSVKKSVIVCLPSLKNINKNTKESLIFLAPSEIENKEELLFFQ